VSPHAGIIQKMNTWLIGMTVVELGAGRSRPEDKVDYGVGAVFHKKVGDTVRKNEPIATLYARSEDHLKKARQRYLEAIVVGPQKCRKPRLVYEIIKDGKK